MALKKIVLVIAMATAVFSVRTVYYIPKAMPVWSLLLSRQRRFLISMTATAQGCPSYQGKASVVFSVAMVIASKVSPR